jgi:hypothetical protein
MNNFNIVHSAIRKSCSEPDVPNEECLKQIKSELHESYHEHIDFYLSFLQDLGLIKYEDGGKIISITEQGRNVPEVFKD